MTEPSCYVERKQKKHSEDSLYMALMLFPVPIGMYMVMDAGWKVFKKYLFGKPAFEMGLLILLVYTAVTGLVTLAFIWDYLLATETVKVPVKHSEVKNKKVGE